MKIFLTTLIAVFLTFCAALAGGANATDFAALRAEAEAHYARGSFELANRAYSKVEPEGLSEDDARWLAFRLADTRWRSAAASNTADPSEFDAAEGELKKLLRKWKRSEERSETWALTQQSLGDFSWRRRNTGNWALAWPHYKEALDYWAASTELELARSNYLGLVNSIIDRPGASEWMRGHSVRQLPEEVLRGAAKLARSADEVGAANYWLASRLRDNSYDARTHERARAAYLAAIGAGREAEHYEAALFEYGTWLEERGVLKQSVERGTWTEPDFVAALQIYRRLMNEFERGEAAHWREAAQRIKAIQREELTLSVGRFFLPGSELTVHLQWRNVDEVRLSLFELDLVGDVTLRERKHSAGAWLHTVEVSELRGVQRWPFQTGDEGLHTWGSDELELDFELEPGAYLLEARAGSAHSRELVLVSDAGLVVKTAGDDVLAWFCDVESGAPIEGAEVKLFHRNDSDEPWTSARAKTDVEGIARFDLSDDSDQRHSYFLAAKSGARQAFSLAWEPWTSGAPADWKLYAFTDRAAYRPGQEVSWKLTGRRRDESRYQTPAGEALEWELMSQTGAVQAKGRLEFNDFGSAWGTLQPEESWPLGLYHLHLFEAGAKVGERGALIASESLFRLEEYKLPEFIVGVEFAEGEDGTPERFVPGEALRATIAADYYFGGGVAQATVVVEVFKRSFWATWRPTRECGWLFEDQNSTPYFWQGQGERVHRETLKTDAEGRAEFSFETGPDDGNDYEYTIKASVTDSSRREVSGSGVLRVTRQGWFAYLQNGHNLYRPGDAAEIELKTLNANNQPVQASGELVLLRRVWREAWINPQGELIEGDELRQQRALSRVFPPPAEPGKLAWKLERRGYDDERISSIKIQTDAAGEALWNPVLARSGSYIVRFSGQDERGITIQAETALIAATEETRELDQESGAFTLLLDKDTFSEGETGAIMLTAPVRGRTVLFTVETDEVIEYRVIRLDGTVKLISVDVNERWVPNVFVTAAGFHAGELQSDVQRVVVPPRKHFLDVEVALEPEVCLPGQKAVMTVKLSDHEGQPVAGEVAVSLVDEAIAAIQEPLAIDPRQFFYGETRAHRVQLRSSSYEKSYERLVRDDQGHLRDARFVWSRSAGEEIVEHELSEVTADLNALGYVGGASGGLAKAKRGRSMAPMAEASCDFLPGRDSSALTTKSEGGGSGGGQLIVTVRKDFRETALWQPDVTTGADGTASIEFTYPDSLTSWRATARAATRESSFGEGLGAGRTRLPLSVRLQAPRFFVVGDECIVSLNLDNRTDAALTVNAALTIEGLELLGFVGEDSAPDSVTIPAQGGLRLDWRVRATTVGTATFSAKVQGGEYGDAIERTLPVHAHGIQVLEAKSGRFDGEGVDLTIELPGARDAGSTELFVQVTPSLAVTMLDALPYLVDYPYGCTEQTLSRFVPATVVRGTLERLGLDAEECMTRAFGGIEAEFASKTQGETKGSLKQLEHITALGLERLYGLQHGDGSWSWWKHGSGDPFMTAYAVWSLTLALEAGVELETSKLDAAGRWLGERLVEQQASPELHAWMLFAHATWLSARPTDSQERFARAALQARMAARADLNAYGRALLALAAARLGSMQDARILADNLIDGVQRDEAPDASIVQLGHAAGGTQSPRAHWGGDGIGYRWSDGGVEATAFALMALVAVDPEHELVEPAADWLVANRRGAQWQNTKTTAIVVLALDRYLAATGQLAREVGFTVTVNGTQIASSHLAGSELIAAPARFTVPTALLRDGDNRIEIRRTAGEGPLFFSAQARFFSAEEPIKPRGHEIFVRRQYFRLVAKPTLLRGFVYERVALQDGDSLVSGERVEVVLTIEAKNHLEYLLFEDLKPAGLEATQLKSGEALYARQLRRDEAEQRFGDARNTRSGRGQRTLNERPSAGYTGKTRQVHQELRDRKVAIFLDQCPEGLWELRYDLRAESPGSFHALPLMAGAMYVPEVRANGAELRLTVIDREDLQ